MLTERTTTLFVSIFYFQKCQTRDFTDLDRPCQAFFLLVHQVGIRRPHRPLAAVRRSPRVTLGS